MSQTLSYEAVWFGFTHLDHLILMLDFAAWVDIEFDGQPDTTSVSLLKGPQKEHDAQVDSYLAEHKGELETGYLECPTCGSQYSQESGYTTCPTERIPFERVFEGIPTKQVEIVPGKEVKVLAGDVDYKSIDLPPSEKCDTPLVVTNINESEHVLRERAGFALARQGDIVSRRHVVCAWLTQELRPGKPASDGDVQLPLGDVRKHVTAMMEREVDRLIHRLAQVGDPLYLSGRRNLWPAGDTLQERHLDYRDIRDGLISRYTRLLNITTEHPEFVESGEVFPEPRSFPLPILSGIERPDDGASGIPDVNAAIAQLTRQVEELKRAPVALPLPNTISNRQAAKLYADLTITKPDPPRIGRLIKDGKLAVEADGRTTEGAIARYAQGVLKKRPQTPPTKSPESDPEEHWEYTCPRCFKKAHTVIGLDKVCRSCFLAYYDMNDDTTG